MFCLFNFLLKRITIPEIKKHHWFLKNLPKELLEGEETNYTNMDKDQPSQSVEEILLIIEEARAPSSSSITRRAIDEDVDSDEILDDVDTGGDFVTAA